uniref:Uncharacterized protein n=1 Tax=Anguilla anguilla TaxID=7936 RepID=A0A0E9VQ45_ANGAN
MSPCVNKNGVSYGTSGHHHFSLTCFTSCIHGLTFQQKFINKCKLK